MSKQAEAWFRAQLAQLAASNMQKARSVPTVQEPLPDAVQWYGGVKSDDELFPPTAQPAPVPEGVKLMQMLDALVQKYSDQLYDGKGAKAANDFELDVAAIRLTVAAQPAPVQECLVCNGMGFIDGVGAKCRRCDGRGLTLATTPPAAPVPLTEPQRKAIYDAAQGLDVMKAILLTEAAYGIKET